MGSVLIAYITAFLAYLYLKFTNPAYNSSGGFDAPIIAFGFLIGLQMVSDSSLKYLTLGKYCSCTDQKWCCDTICCDGGGSSGSCGEFSGFVSSDCQDLSTTRPWSAAR